MDEILRDALVGAFFLMAIAGITLLYIHSHRYTHEDNVRPNPAPWWFWDPKRDKRV